MSAGSGELLDRGLDFFADMVASINDDEWKLSTPCVGWNTRDLVGHVAVSMSVGMAVMQGLQPTWPDAAHPGDLVDGEPSDFWRGVVRRVRDVLRTADLARPIETPLGQTVADDLAIPVIDLYVHAWDLGVAVGVNVEIPADLIEYAHSYIDPLPYDAVRGDNRAFAAPTSVPVNATPTERFVAWTGRDLPSDRR